MIVALGISTTGANITTGAASANAAIPTSAGSAPRYIRITASVAACVRLGVGNTTAAVSTDAVVQPGEALVLQVGGNTYLAAIQQTAAGVVQFSPVDNL